MPSLLVLAGASVRYGAVQALRRADLRVGEGEVVALIGPNGAGKSSLLSAVAGLAPVAEGTVELNGKRISGRSAEAIARQGLRLVPEGRRIFAALTVRENLRVGAIGRRDRARVHKEMTALLERFPILGERADQPAGGLSGGEAQQLAICRALVGGPRVLLLDEPSLGLAPKLVRAVYDLVGELKGEGRTLLVVEQAAPHALRLADRAYVAAHGDVREVAVGDLAHGDRLRDAYLGTAPAQEEAAWLS